MEAKEQAAVNPWGLFDQPFSYTTKDMTLFGMLMQSHEAEDCYLVLVTANHAEVVVRSVQGSKVLYRLRIDTMPTKDRMHLVELVRGYPQRKHRGERARMCRVMSTVLRIESNTCHS